MGIFFKMQYHKEIWKLLEGYNDNNTPPICLLCSEGESIYIDKTVWIKRQSHSVKVLFFLFPDPLPTLHLSLFCVKQPMTKFCSNQFKGYIYIFARNPCNYSDTTVFVSLPIVWKGVVSVPSMPFFRVSP